MSPSGDANSSGARFTEIAKVAKVSRFSWTRAVSRTVLLPAAHMLRLVPWDAVLANYQDGEPDLLRPFY